MNIKATLEANAQFAETGKPGMRALDDPAMSAKTFFAVDTASRNSRRNAWLFQVAAAAGKVVALVGMQLVRTLARLTIQPGHGRYGIERRLKRHRVVSVGTRDRDGKRNAPGIYDKVPLRPELAPVGRVGAGFLAPGGWEHSPR
jgi:hypothetical protein